MGIIKLPAFRHSGHDQRNRNQRMALNVRVQLSDNSGDRTYYCWLRDSKEKKQIVVTPQKFTEVGLKILGIYSLVESVVAISQGIGFYGFIGIFSKIEHFIPYVLPAFLLLTFGWMLLQFSKTIVGNIFDRGEPLPPSPNRLYREWHISLLSLCGGFLTVWGIPILLSATSYGFSLLFLEPSRTQGWTRDSLFTQLVCNGVFIIFEIGIFMCLLFLAKPLTNAILKFQDSKLT